MISEIICKPMDHKDEQKELEVEGIGTFKIESCSGVDF